MKKQEFTLPQAVAHAEMLLRRGRVADGETVLARLPGTDKGVRLAQARLSYAQGDNQAAFDQTQALLKEVPENGAAQAFLSYLWAKSGAVGKTRSYMAALQKQAIDTADFWGNLAVVFHRGKNFQGAIQCAQRSLSHDDQCEEIWLTLGASQREDGNPRAAISSYFRALALNPLRGESYQHLHVFFYEIGEFDKATHFRNIARDCGVTGGGLDLGEAHCLLKEGNLAEGFRKYRARYQNKTISNTRPELDIPHWQGEDLSGKRLLVYCEQGIGDVIQFARFLRDLPGRGAAVTFLCRPSLVDLMVQSFPAVTVCSKLPPGVVFDYQSYVIDLVVPLDLSPDTVPYRGRYLSAPACDKFGDIATLKGPKIGFAWHGGRAHVRDHLRSIPFVSFKRLLDLPGFDWVSLQVAPNASLPTGAHVYDVTERIGNLADTAALIDSLDLVICVDTSIAHLAGALGKPAWVLLDQCADWRWQEGTTQSYWYDSVRLLRQKEFGNWDQVIAEVVDALQQDQTLFSV